MEAQTQKLNKHLSSYMPGLTAKVFRTYNASYTMSTLLQNLKQKHLAPQEAVKVYNDCNREVAILCNHKRTVGASHEAQMEKLGDRVRRLLLCHMLVKKLTFRADQGITVSEVAHQDDADRCRS
jgi:DNA topoisomerase I